MKIVGQRVDGALVLPMCSSVWESGGANLPHGRGFESSHIDRIDLSIWVFKLLNICV